MTIDGTFFKDDTPLEVCKWLNTSMQRRQKIRIFYGDRVTGSCWNEENDVLFVVGRSTGRMKIPLAIITTRSSWGSSVIDNCIIRIDTKDSHGKIVTVYQAEGAKFDNFISTDIGTVYNETKDELYARCKSGDAGKRLADFMNGKRWNK